MGARQPETEEAETLGERHSILEGGGYKRGKRQERRERVELLKPSHVQQNMAGQS